MIKKRERERQKDERQIQTYIRMDGLILLLATYPAVGRHIGTHGRSGVHDGWLADVQLHLCIDIDTCTCIHVYTIVTCKL